MLFSCKPPPQKCEWDILRNFVAHYNRVYDKSYTHSECLDRNNSTEPEPELLLEAIGETPIVLERKAVVWPYLYIRDHSNEHLFFDIIQDLLGNEFRDNPYRLLIGAIYLKSKKKKEIEKMAQSIARTILSNIDKVKRDSGFSFTEPFAWLVHPTPFEQRDETSHNAGLSLIITEDFSQEVPSLSQQGETQKGLCATLEQKAEEAARKFESYRNCIKIFIVEFYSDDPIITDEYIIKTVRSARIPAIIDQVWVAKPEWASEEKYEILWDRLR